MLFVNISLKKSADSFKENNNLLIKHENCGKL